MKPTELISSEDRYDRQTARVLDVNMAYVDAGAGDPILFLHGNPTSSYLWRNVIPYLESLGRCVAPDLVGMGFSDKLRRSGPGRYRFVEHRSYLDALMEAIGIGDGVVIVGHDWGGVLGIDWARRHPEAVRGIAAMETILRPLSWSDWPERSRGIFQAIRSSAGEEVVLAKNAFVERILPASVMRELGEGEMEAYRRPFATPGESRRPVLSWARELPIDGDPPDVTEIISACGAWLETAGTPSLLVHADPGFLTAMQPAVSRGWSNHRDATVRGIHFIQEDSPHELGRLLAEWVATLLT